MTTIKPTTYTEVTRIHKSAVKKGSVVITSARHGEGSSLTAQLMAARSAENGEKTLLVDLNTHNSTVTKAFGLDKVLWSLSGREPSDDLSDLFVQSAGQDNLFVLPAPMDGHTVDLLKDPRHAAHFFDIVERQFDHVVVDTTPVSATNRQNADAVILASAARRCVVVLLARVTPEPEVAAAVKTLREAGAHIEGVVVNDHVNPSLKGQLLSLAGVLKRIAPGLHSWLTYRIQNSTTL